MRHEPTTDELPIQKTVELPDGRETVELPDSSVARPDRESAESQAQRADHAKSPGDKDAALSGQPTDHLPVEARGPKYSESLTAELPTGDRGRHRPETIQQRQTGPTPRKFRFWRELTGALAAGTVLLAIAVLVLQTIAWLKGMPGLGVVVLVGHLVGAALAIVAQRMVDRRAGKPALAAGLGLCAVVVVILVLFWWI
jgi:hypothetical protein